jgi:hypothetical protein
MSALQLILINVIVLGGASWLVYAMTHGRKNNRKGDSSSSLEHHH